jgi:beta-galactosidase
MKTFHLDRRQFLLGSAAAGALAAQTNPPAASDDSRRIYPLNRNWLYGGKALPGVLDPGYADSQWERIALPSSNARLPWHSFDEKDFQFISAYRRHFRPPAAWQGKRVFVDFAGAMAASTVAINGH